MRSPESVLERYIQAVSTVNKAALLSLYSSDLRMFDLIAPFEFSGRSAFVPRLDEWFDSAMQDQGAVPTRVETRVGVDLAVMSMFMCYAFTDEEGGRQQTTVRLTWVLAPEDDDWKILHEHSSVPLSESHNKTPQFEP